MRTDLPSTTKREMLKNRIKQQYTVKRFKNISVLTGHMAFPGMSDDELARTCLDLFSGNSRHTTVKEGKYKTILITSIRGVPCLVKKYRNTGTARGMKSWFSPSRALTEFHAGITIHEKGITTAVPFFMAEKHSAGFVRESMVVLPFIDNATELKDLFFSRSEQRNSLLEEFGKFTRRIFSCGIFQNDYSLNNFMVAMTGEKASLYFIDFERVTIKDGLSEPEKILLLSKLNRVGREISLRDRLCFLKGYLGSEQATGQDIRNTALQIRKNTINVLKRDLKRCRLTSIYTHGRYNRIKTRAYSGLYKKGLSGLDIETLGRQVFSPDQPSSILLDKQGKKELRVLRLKKKDAQWLWSCITVFRIAGSPLKIPPVLICNRTQGVIIAEPAAMKNFCHPEATCRQSQLRFLKTNFSDELEKMKKLATKGMQAKNR